MTQNPETRKQKYLPEAKSSGGNILGTHITEEQILLIYIKRQRLIIACICIKSH